MLARPPASLLYLPAADVARAAGEIDAVAAVREALLLHAAGETTLPEEASLHWTTAAGDAARSLVLPGALWSDPPSVGVKVINSSLGNNARGLPRARGLTLLFDAETAQPAVILEGARLSILRTVAYTVLTVTALAAGPLRQVAVIGCGAIGAAHAERLAATAAGARFVLYDADADRAAAQARALETGGIDCSPAASAEEAVRDADVVVTSTTSSNGYLRYNWLASGALVAHVSLDDVLPEVVQRADLVLVDDWHLVAADSRRLLGRMYRAGQLAGPGNDDGGKREHAARAVDGTLADVLAGAHPGRTAREQIILSNPFGMGILDVALAAETAACARRLGLGIELPI